MKKSIWLPCALLLVGVGFYVYDGIEYNTWMHNLPLIIVDVLIVLALFWSLRKKQELASKREAEDKKNT